MVKGKRFQGDRGRMKVQRLLFGWILILLTLFTFAGTNKTFAGSDNNWKTYKNEKHRFEVQYPPDLDLITPYGEDIIHIKNDSRFYAITTEELSGIVVKDNMYIPFANLSTQEILSMNLQRRCPDAGLESINWVSIKIDGIEGIMAVNSENNCIKKYLPWAAVKKDNKIYHFQFLRGDVDEFNKILSIFRFQ